MIDFIRVYRRAQAIADGVLIDITKTANEAGILCPVAMTSAAWGRCVAVPSGVAGQDEQGRLWGVLKMLFNTVRAGKGGQDTRFSMLVKNGEESPQPVLLKALIGYGDHGEHVVTIMLPNED